MNLFLVKHGLLYFICACALSLSSSVVAADSLKFERCHLKSNATEIDAQCATLTRPENPNKPDSKTIELFVTKLPSSSPNPEADAFTIIQGGPGGSSVDMAISYHNFLELVRKKRDVIVIDQRGTGRSNKLNCDFDDEPPIDFDPVYNKQNTLKCVDKLKESDLSAYTTSVAVQDLEAMRVAGGYSQLSLYGVSYGTRVAQHYLRRYPQSTRTIIIDGVVDIGLNLAGAEIARRSQDAFDQMAHRCNTNEACSKQFGNIKTTFTELRARLKSQPVEIATAHPLTGKIETVTLSDNDLLVAVRLMPYSTEGISLLPLLIHNAHQGNYAPLAAQSLLTTESLSQSFAMGMHNSVMCTEDAPYVSVKASENAKDTYFGSLMIDNMRVTCENWPKGIIDDDFLNKFDSDKPVLILSGETDPITPPANGQRAADMFSNAKHIIVPAHGHGVVGRGCMPYLVDDFLINLNFEELKTDCITREQALPFFIDSMGPKP